MRAGAGAHAVFQHVSHPGILDVPEQIDSVLLEYADENGPVGARGHGRDAVHSPGASHHRRDSRCDRVWVDEIPLAPWKVLKALQKKIARGSKRTMTFGHQCSPFSLCFDPHFLKGGGDLGTGVAWRLHKSGFPVILTELAQPLVVRRTVAFASAAFDGDITVQGVTARRTDSFQQAAQLLDEGVIPLLVDPETRGVTISSDCARRCCNCQCATREPTSPMPLWSLPWDRGLCPGSTAMP